MTEACDSSGDEAPEEVTLSLSKSQATSRRKQERAIQAEQRLLVKVGNKKKRRENSQTLQEAATPATTLPESDGDELPDELIETLARNNQCRRAEEASLLPPSQAQQPRKRRRRVPILQRQAGPVVVEVLNSSSAVKPSDAAVTFARTQLHAKKRRSSEMLWPAQNWSHRHHAVVRGSGPAIFFVKNKDSKSC